MLSTYKLLKKLIQIKSFSGQEQEIINFIESLLTKHNLSVSRIRDCGLAVKIKGEHNNKAIIFNGHIDTVPVTNLLNWHKPPFGKKAGKLASGKIYGLGASDMKGTIASFIQVCLYFKKKVPPCDLWFSFVEKEETDGSGSKNFIAWFKKLGYFNQYKNLAAIVGEPTNLKNIVIGHKGSVFLKLSVTGNSGHGAYPNLIKKNVNVIIARIINKLERRKKGLLSQYNHSLMGKPTISVTNIKSGDLLSPNIYSNLCEISLDVRTTPNFPIDVIGLIKNSLLPDEDFEISSLYPYEDNGSVIVSENELIVQAILESCKRCGLAYMQGSCDMYFFVKSKISACIFGPGDINLAHKTNEYCFLKDVEESIRIYIDTINYYSLS